MKPFCHYTLPVVGVTKDSLLGKSIAAMTRNAQKQSENVENHNFATEEARISRSVTYMILLRQELAKQCLRRTISQFAYNKHLYRLDVKKHARSLVDELSKYDHMTGTIIDGKTLEYYDGLTDHYCKRMQDEVHACLLHMHGLMTSEPEYARLDPHVQRLVSSLHLSVVLVCFCFERMEFEISHYHGRCQPLHRLRFLSLRTMYFKADGLLSALQRTVFGSRAQKTVYTSMVDGLDALLERMASPEHIEGIIREYDKEFEGTPVEQPDAQ